MTVDLEEPDLKLPEPDEDEVDWDDEDAVSD